VVAGSLKKKSIVTANQHECSITSPFSRAWAGD